MRLRPLRPSAPAVLLLLVLAAVGAFAASPRHRALYARLLGSQAPAPAVRTPAEEPGLPARRQGRVPTGAPERVTVPVVETPPAVLPSTAIAPPWYLKEFAGRASVEVTRDDSRLALRLVSDGTSFALYRHVGLDLREFPILTWRWKAVTLPAGADVRSAATDDQVAQVYLIFPRWPSPRRNSEVLGYVWDTRAPVGAKLTSPRAANVRLVVLESGATRAGRWVEEKRNAYQDYVELFGREPPRVGQVALMVDSDNTASRAEALFADLAFRRALGACERSGLC